MKHFIICVLFLMISVNVFALDRQQKEILTYAYNYGNTIEYLNQGWGETIASIVYQETKAGYHKYQVNGVIVGDRGNKNKYRSLGVMQVQLPAARDVQRWFPNIIKDKFGKVNPTDEELIFWLLYDYKFNIRVGSAYYIKMLELSDNNWRKSILAYNRGANNNGVDVNDYVNKVLHWRKEIVMKEIK